MMKKKPLHIKQIVNRQWVFWDESWTCYYGPYESEEEAIKESKKYAVTIGHVVGKKETNGN